MFWLKHCPRCKGALYAERDRYGDYIACAHCGHYLTPAEEAALKHFGRLLVTAEAPAASYVPASRSRTAIAAKR